MNVAGRSAQFIWRYRFLLSGAVVLVTLVAGRQLADLSVSNTLEIWYPEDAPELVSYREFQQAYGSDEIVVVAVRGGPEQTFDSDAGSALVGQLTDRLFDIEGVATVTSLVTVPESLAEARGRLLSADGRTTALVVQTMTGARFEATRHRFFLDIRQAVAEFGLESYLGGYGVVFDGLNEASTRGSATLIVSAHVGMIVLLMVFFRRLSPVLMTLLTVGVATVWTMGLYAATGHQLNMVTMALPTLVLVIGIADCMHVLRSVAAQDRTLEQRERVINGLAAIIAPCFLTTITTAAGFLGLTTSGLPVVQQLGWFGATGMFAAFIASVTLVPTALSWQRTEPRKQVSVLDQMAPRLFELAAENARLVAVIFCLLLVVAGYGISQLNSDTDSIGYLKKTHIVRQDSDFIESTIGPYVPVEFIVSSGGPVMTTGNLDAIWAWQKRVTNMAEVGWSWSLISALDLSRGSAPSDAGMDVLQDRLSRMRQFSPMTVRAMAAGDDELRVSFGTPIMSARSLQALIRRIEDAAELPATLHLQPAGYSPLYTRIVDEIVTSQIRGFTSAIVLIVLLLGLAMRSWRRVLLALPANAVPVALTMGVMGLTGIPLDVASATIASVILGLVVDDTVHMLRPSRPAGIYGSMRLAAGEVGGTLMMTSLVLAGGFLVLGLAEIRSIAWFGVLTSLAVVIAIVTDLTLLPALAKLFSTRQGPLRAPSVCRN